MTPQSSCFTKGKKVILILTGILILGVLVFIVFQQSKNLKIDLANQMYLQEYVNIEKSIFKKSDDKNQALIRVLIGNSGNRIIDSLPIEINYYDQNGEFLGKDDEDILAFAEDILLPNKEKIFEINVTCPDDTTDAKLKIKY